MDKRLDKFSNEELKQFLLKKFDERRLVNGRLYNNATQDNVVMNQETFINWYLNKPYILSGYSCFYKNQDDSVNISSAALENLGVSRSFNKKKMEAAPHGSDEYVYYRILQLTFKVLMNSYYGILGEKNSVFYNPFVQNSITTTGQDLITTSIIAMEAFLSNNVLFADVDDIINFIYNVSNETPKLDILTYVDYPISKTELLEYFNTHKRPEFRGNMANVEAILDNLSPEMLTRLYYKNQIPELIKNEWFKARLDLLSGYEYAERPEDAMVPHLEDFKEKVLEFAFYDQLYEDRYKRAVKDFRKSIITIDTDSNFINLNPYIQQTTALLGLDKTNSAQQMTVMNIYVNIVTEALRRTFWTLTENMNLLDKAKPLINMKSEFTYKRILLTRNKKSYAGIITAELGKLLSRPVLDMKGLSIRKTNVPKTLRKQFTKILKEDILEAPKINLKSIIDKYDDLGEQIETSLKNSSTEYLLPKNLELIESYKTPDTIEAVRAALIWNALEPENQIIPPEKINLVKLNCTNENDPRLLALQQTHPDKYKAIMERVFNHNTSSNKIDISRFGLSCIAIPKSVEKIPEYLLPFIDYQTMVNNNMTNGYIILESLGIWCQDVLTTKYKSNIVEI